MALIALAAAVPAAGQDTSAPSSSPSQASPASPPGDEILDSAKDDAPARPHVPAPAESQVRVDEVDAGIPQGDRARPRARFKSDLLLPFGSVFLPGLGQYFQGDATGAAYSGAALAGLTMMVVSIPALSEVDASVSGSADGPGWWPYRTFVLGGLAYQGSGFLSAYSAFRRPVPRFQDEDSLYRFLGPRESIGELMRSPFRFDHLAQPSAWIPVGLLAGALAYDVAYMRTHHRGARWTAAADDYLFVGAESWNAGVSEEAVFRGWIYPASYQYLWQNFWLADGAQALLFGAAHYDPQSNPLPWPQALLGFYFGWLVKKNGWSLSEAIFVHAWWDMLLFADQVATSYRDSNAGGASFRIDLPVRW